MLLLGWRSHVQANGKFDQAAQMHNTAAGIEARFATRLAKIKAESSQLENTHKFVQRLAVASSGEDASVAIARIRQAARTWVRVLRVRIGEADHRLYVEGALDHSRDSAKHLALFIANLRAAGFDPTAVDPPLGTRSADYFAYALDPARPVPTETAP